MADSNFKAGVARVDLTPPLSAPHASWGAQVHVLPDGVDDPLWATVLVVDDGTNRVAFVDLDIVILTTAQSDAIRASVGEVLEISPEQVRVSVTHNHAGPPPNSWNWTKQGQEALDGYYDLMSEYAAGAARTAFLSMKPALVGVGSGQSAVAMNRRESSPDGRTVTGVNPDGVIDPEVLVVRIDSTDGEPIAAIVGYTMHPTTLGPSNRLVSPDWPGYLKRTVETLTGTVCLFAQGATGDVGPGYEGFTDDPNVPKKLGTMIGCEAARVYLSLYLPDRTFKHERVWESGAPLAVWKGELVDGPAPVVRAVQTSVTLPLAEQVPLTKADAAVQAAQDRLEELKRSGALAKEIEAATFVVKRANMTRSRTLMYEGKADMEAELHLLQIGPAVIVGTGGEPFCEIGLAIKERSPFEHTWYGGYTSGWAGYLATAEEFPRSGYEVYTSPFAPEAAQAMVDGTVKALEDLAAKG
jgi:hypothetical protein